MKILIEGPDKFRHEYRMENEVLSIGRSIGCNIVIPSENLSRRHCQIELKDGDVYITDLGSSNGTFVDNERIPAHEPILYRPVLSLNLATVYTLTITLGEATSVNIQNVLLPRSKTKLTSITQLLTPKIEKPPIPVIGKPRDRTMLVPMILSLILLGAVLIYYVTRADVPVIQEMLGTVKYEKSHF